MASNNILELLVRLKDEASAGLRNIRGNLAPLGPVAAGVAREFLNLKGNIAAVSLKGLVAGAKEVTDAIFSIQSAIAGAAFAGAVKSITDVSSAFEGFEASLTTTLGSSQKAKEAMSWITEFTAKTPYELDQVADGFTKLSAYGLDATKHMKTLGDTASSMNKPLNMAVEAMADAVAFQFERLREFGITTSQAGDKVTFAWKQNGQQMTQTVQKTATDVENALLGIFSGNFDGAMAKFSQTWQGMWSNLLDHVTNFKKSIGDAGLFDYLKQQLAETLAKIDEWKANGSLDEWAVRISNAIKGVLEVIKGFAVGVGEMIAKFEPLIAAAVEMAPAFADIAKWVGAASVAITALSPLILSAASALGGLAVSAALFKGAGLAVEAGLITGRLAELITRVLAVRTALTMVTGALAAFAGGFAVGTLLNQFAVVQQTAQIFFGVMHLGVNEAVTKVMELRKAWNIAQGDFAEADAIQAQIDAQKEAGKAIEDTIKSIHAEYEAMKTAGDGKVAVVNAGKDAVVAAENEKKAAVQSLADFRMADAAAEKAQIAERIAGIQDEAAKRSAALEDMKADIAESEQAGIISHAEAVEQKLAAEMKFKTERLKIAQELAAEAKKHFGEESEEYKKANDERLKAETDLSKQIQTEAKQRIKLQKDAEKELTAALKAEYEERQKMADAELDVKGAKYEKAIAEIENAYRNETITYQESIQKKMELDIEWTQTRISAIQKSMSDTAAMYGAESAEYQKLVAEKIRLDSELMVQKQDLKEVMAQPVEMNVDTAAASGKIADLESTAKNTRRVISEPISMDIDTDPAKAALRELAAEAQQTAAQAYKYMEQARGQTRGSLVGGGHSATLEAIQRAEYEGMRRKYEQGMRDWKKYKKEVEDKPVKANTEFTGSGSSTKPLSEKILEMTGAMDQFRKKAESEASANVNFTGSGSPTKPLSEKIRDMKNMVSSFAKGIPDAVMNTNMGSLSNAVAAVPTGGGSGGIAGLKDMGKMQVQLGGKAGDIVGKPEVLKWLKEALGDEARMGYA